MVAGYESFSFVSSPPDKWFPNRFDRRQSLQDQRLLRGYRNKVVGIKFIRKPTEGQFTLSSRLVSTFSNFSGSYVHPAFFSQKTYNPMNMDMIIIIIIIIIIMSIITIIIIMNHPHPHLLNNQAVTRRLKQRLPGSKADVGNVILHMSKPFLFWKVVLKHSKTSRKMFFSGLTCFFCTSRYFWY